MPAKPWVELTERERRVEIATHTPTELLFWRMYRAVVREFINDDGVRAEEQMFKDKDQHAVLMAIAGLAASLIVKAADPRVARGCGLDWEEMIEDVAAEMRASLVDSGPGCECALCSSQQSGPPAKN